MKTAPDPNDVQDFQFKQSSISQVLDAFTSIPIACSLLVADKKRGLLYIGRDTKIVVLKPGVDSDPEWKIELDLPLPVSKIMLSCDCSYLAVAPHQPFVLIYDVLALTKGSLQLLHEIRISATSAEAYVTDLRWNPTVPGMLCTVASDYTVGSFQIKEEKEKTIGLKALEKLNGLDVLCAAWSPKGKQIVVGCKNGNIVQLKPDLKVARSIAGPSPPIGEIITILWISNYQFCAAYLGGEQRSINVLIIDAPKGDAKAIFTCYEDITYGITDAEGEGSIPRYYFDHVPEWGLIIAASSGSSEIAVLGSTDGGATWSSWQLVDSGRAQLPLICTTESYPVGMTIDRSSVRKLPWGAESTLPHPVPILHILGTSGQLCSFHMVNLFPNCPPITSPPTEIVAPPAQPRPSIAPAETSFVMSGAVTSTPRPKQPENIPERPKPAPIGNIFGDSLKFAGFFQQPEAEKRKPEQKPVAPPIVEVKAEPPKETHVAEIPKPEIKLAPVKEIAPPEPAEQKATIDESDWIRAYLEEQNLFEKELRNRLEPQVWECGTDDERKQLVERSADIDQFLRALREITNSLSSDIAYLKALLLQSFAWVEETKSKNAATISITTRNCGDNSKITDLQKLYYYTQTQLTQASKVLDLEWSEHKNDEISRMKIPSLEFVYQNLILHSKIVMQEKNRLQQLKNQWKLIVRTNGIPGLNRSMSNLNITSPKSTTSIRGNTGVIEARCKTIASKTLSFTPYKQLKLKEHLCVFTPRIIKPVNPSPIQDRLEATLSSLASLNTVTADAKNKVEHPVIKQAPIAKQTTEKTKQQSPLASLNSIVARIGSSEINNTMPQVKAQPKLPSVSIPFPPPTTNKLPQAEKKIITPITANVPQPKLKQDTIAFGQISTPVHTQPNLTKGFPKVDSISFGAPTQKPQDTLIQKTLPKEAVIKNGKEVVANDSPKRESNLFSTGSLKDVLTSEIPLGKPQANTQSTSLTPAVAMTTPTKSDAMSTFSFAIPATAPTIAKTTSQDTLLTSQPSSAQTFSFASKPLNTTPATMKILPTTTEPAAQGSLDLTGLSLGLQTSNQANSSPSQDANNTNPNGSYYYKSPVVSSTNPDYNYPPTVSDISITQIPISQIPASTTSSVSIEEVPTTTKVSTLPTSTVQALPAPVTQPPLFSGQPTPLNIPIFGGSTSTPATSTFSVPTVSSTSGFGTQPSSSGSIFSGFNANAATSAVTTTTATSSTSPFYSSLPKPTFGEAATPSSTSAASTLNFGNATAAASSISPVFGKPAAPLLANSQFPSTPVSSTPNAFGKSIISPASMPFGSSSNAPIFSNMPATSANTSIFPGTNSNSIFGGSTPASSAGSMFGGNTATMSTFGSPMFGAQLPSTGTTSFFDGNASTTSPAVGGAPTGSTVFGGTSANVSPMGQSMLGAQPAFGETPTFGSRPAFGSPPMFDQSKQIFGGGFGASTFGASAAPPAFGNPPTMGGSPPPIENNMPKVFGNTGGSSTFESLASQSGGLTFSSLAQKSPTEAEKPPVFTGGSSFSSWR